MFKCWRTIVDVDGCLIVSIVTMQRSGSLFRYGIGPWISDLQSGHWLAFVDNLPDDGLMMGLIDCSFYDKDF